MVEGDDKSVGKGLRLRQPGPAGAALQHALRGDAVVQSLLPGRAALVVGDWFGGRLRPLFGTGILDQPLTGNMPGRRAPGMAHGRYFSYPDVHGPDDVATQLQATMRLNIDHELAAVAHVPAPLPETRSGVRSATP